MKYWNSLAVTIVFLFSRYCEGINIAENKTASQFANLNYAGFEWTADKAVDGCTDQGDPEGERCCSSSEGTGASNYWKVDLGQQYSVGLIIVYGRYPGGEVQLSGFQVFTQETDSGTEVLLYTETGDYAPGIFNITVNPERTVRSVVIRRPAGVIITLCEVEVYDFSITSTAATTMTITTSSGQGYSTGVSVSQPKTVLMSLVTVIMSVFVLGV